MSLEDIIASVKSEGSSYFSAKKFIAAKEKYTEGIALVPPNSTSPKLVQLLSTLYYNRSLCNKQMGKWEEVESDALSALAIDEGYFKAHYLLGQALLNKKDHYPQSVSRLERALNLCKRQKLGAQMVREVQGTLALARYIWFTAKEEEDTVCDDMCQSLVLSQLEAVASKVDSIPACVPPYRPDPIPLDDNEESDKGGGGGGGEWGKAGEDSWENSEMRTDDSQMRAEDSPLDYLRAIFRERANTRRDREIPEWLCDPITFEVMEEAVVTPRGHSFDRRYILAWLKTKQECPVTRTYLTEAQLVPNISLRKAISAWVSKNPWANPRIPRKGDGSVNTEL